MSGGVSYHRRLLVFEQERSEHGQQDVRADALFEGENRAIKRKPLFYLGYLRLDGLRINGIARFAARAPSHGGHA
jgi:hypothetical protein